MTEGKGRYENLVEKKRKWEGAKKNIRSRRRKAGVVPGFNILFEWFYSGQRFHLPQLAKRSVEGEVNNGGAVHQAKKKKKKK